MHHTTAKRTMTELEALRLVEMKETQTGGEQKITITLKEDPKFKWFTTKGFQEAQRIDDRRYQSFVLKGQKEAEISSANFVPREGVEDQ
jgi:hypothetical protein